MQPLIPAGDLPVKAGEPDADGAELGLVDAAAAAVRSRGLEGEGGGRGHQGCEDEKGEEGELHGSILTRGMV